MANNRVIVQAGSVAGAILGTYDIFGTNNGAETVTVFDNTIANFQGDFARGGDVIRLTDTATDFTVRISGSNVEIFSASASITALIPIGTVGTTISFQTGPNQFADSRTLIFDGTNVVLGGQVVTGAVAALNPIAPAQSGQSALLAEPANDDATALPAPAEAAVIAFAALAAPVPDAVSGFDGSAIHFSATDLPPQFYSKLGLEAGMTSFVVNFA